MFTVLLFLLSLPPAFSMPPRPPVRCGGGGAAGCVLSNAYGAWSSDRADCRVAHVAFPTSEQDVVAAVAEASAKGMRVKVVSGFAHTIPKLACPSDGDGSDAILISTAKYNAIEVDVAKRTVTADAGASLRAVVDTAEAEGLSLAAAPYWEGVSIGGLLSTGSHGSSWWGQGGAVHDHAVEVRMVLAGEEADGWARVVRIRKGDPLFGAALVSLGLLGVLSKVTLALEPRFKRSITYDFRGDAPIQDDFMSHAGRHEFADITWYPSQHKAVYRIDDRVPLHTKGNGVNDFIGFQSTLIAVSDGVRASEKVFEKAKNIKGKCLMASAEIAAKKLVGNGLKNNMLLFTGYPVVGFQGKMQTSGSCLYSPASDVLTSCAWDPRIKGLFFYETTAIFSVPQFREFVADVKKLRDLNPNNFCGVDLYNGFLIRFIKKSEAFLGSPDDSVVVDFNYYRATDPATPRLNQDVWEEVEQMAFVRHAARPHWGKNRMVAFLWVQEKYPNWCKFLQAKKVLDPKGVFDSPWSDEVLLGRALDDDGCALDGRCVCSEDRHCSPGEGYFCRPGLVYREARVCRYADPSAQ